ncbi:MAG: hypothetical protein FYV88_0040 [Bacteroidetes bacterium]|nr:hypothetical protein [Bacteroidota bacterium]
MPAAAGGDEITRYSNYNYFIIGSRYYLKKVATLLLSENAIEETEIIVLLFVSSNEL